jgi:signal transduction histidine kinase
MHRRLVRILSLLLSAVLLAVLAIGAVAAWNLKNGFSDYLEGARRRWLAEISHELRRPLTVMRGVS